jgi:hypothetical protein
LLAVVLPSEPIAEAKCGTTEPTGAIGRVAFGFVAAVAKCRKDDLALDVEFGAFEAAVTAEEDTELAFVSVPFAVDAGAIKALVLVVVMLPSLMEDVEFACAEADVGELGNPVGALPDSLMDRPAAM